MKNSFSYRRIGFFGEFLLGAGTVDKNHFYKHEHAFYIYLANTTD